MSRDRNLCRKVEVPLTIEQHERIKKLAKEGGISQGQVVRLLMNAGELAARAAKDKEQEKPAGKGYNCVECHNLGTHPKQICIACNFGNNYTPRELPAEPADTATGD